MAAARTKLTARELRDKLQADDLLKLFPFVYQAVNTKILRIRFGKLNWGLSVIVGEGEFELALVRYSEEQKEGGLAFVTDWGYAPGEGLVFYALEHLVDEIMRVNSIAAEFPDQELDQVKE